MKELIPGGLQPDTERILVVETQAKPVSGETP